MMSKATRSRIVLAVDDHPSILRFIRTGLEIRGMEVITANSGKRAIELAESAEPGVILLDIVMPDMDGIEVLKRIRKTSQVPIIAFSADENVRGEALRFGANDFLAKPFHTDDLVSRIKKLLEIQPEGPPFGS